MEPRRPSPGTDAALALGCTCPVIDNHYGRGYRGRSGEFVFSGDCPVHVIELDLDDEPRDLSDDRDALASAGLIEED